MCCADKYSNSYLKLSHMSGNIPNIISDNSNTMPEASDQRYREMVERIKMSNSRPLNSETMCNSNMGNAPNITRSEASGQRWNEIMEKIKMTNSRPLNSETMCDSRMVQNHLTQQLGEGNGLTAQQFYNRSTAANQFMPPQPASTCSNMSANSFPFPLPLSTRQYTAITKYKNRLDYANQGFFAIEDKAQMRLVLRLLEDSVIMSRLPPPKKNPLEFIDMVCNSVKQKYYMQASMMSGEGSSISSICSGSDNNRTYLSNIQPTGFNRPTSTVSGSSMYLSNIQPTGFEGPTSTVSGYSMFGNNQNSITQKTSKGASTQTLQPMVVMDKICENMPFTSSLAREEEVPPAAPRQNTRFIRSQVTSPVFSPDSSVVNLFDNSEMALRRDELAVQQATQHNRRQPKKRVKASPVNRRPTKTDASLVAQGSAGNQNIPLLPGVKVTRTGRPIKTPVQFWKGLNESKAVSQPTVQPTADYLKNVTVNKKIDLNDSMTLRNNKKLMDRKTPPLRQRRANPTSTPLATVTENDSMTVKKKEPRRKKPTLTQDNKENSVVQENKTTKKQINSKTTKKDYDANHKVKPRKEQSSEEVKKQPRKKPANKRKSTEVDSTSSKKKKVEDTLDQESNLEMSFGDELFGGKMYKKMKSTAHQAVSPTTGMLSAKKAAGTALSKETPPCKVLSQLMNTSCYSALSASSGVNGAPAVKLFSRDKVVKRVTKKIENRSKKVTTVKPTQKKVEKKDSDLKQELENALKATYSALTPLTKAKYTVLLGSEQESDESEAFVSDEDLM